MNLRFLLVVLLVVLAGCATVHRASEPTAPVVISEATWQQIDQDIDAASLASKEIVKRYTRSAMERWREMVYQRTETDFIPWFTSYWTQQWLSAKVGWYKMNSGGEVDPVVNRLTVYLQEQYHERVLDPVAKVIDPNVIMADAITLYLQTLDAHLVEIQEHYRAPQDQFDRRLNDIPAIALAPPPARNASLYQIAHAEPVTNLPAYQALIERVRSANSGAGAGLSDAGISSVAKRAGEKLEGQIATRSAAGAVAAAVGRVAGAVISVVSAGIAALSNESDRPETEVQLRKNLGDAFDKAWLGLMENEANGVMAGVYYISGQIEGSLAKNLPVVPEPAPLASPPQGDQTPLQGGQTLQ
ncbi:hypothetical protein BLL42_23380 [Pseudomonas frederiksbergensis]|uniref:Lipoprotein n=1 Tax=Pseudomonas frederiksbergensis TaxID=104087 RepID=A0A1J0ERT3_9PSED|nr:hypothetical protein [Pseudomonas frederiksbergensis]APC18508.1 hypothetical protein BLL42_23380 [Pseudomonas frederiksbergensis]